MNRPIKKRKKAGICTCQNESKLLPESRTYLQQLTPLQSVSTIVFENKCMIDLRLCPDHTIQAEEQDVEHYEEIPTIYLLN